MSNEKTAGLEQNWKLRKIQFEVNCFIMFWIEKANRKTATIHKVQVTVFKYFFFCVSLISRIEFGKEFHKFVTLQIL